MRLFAPPIESSVLTAAFSLVVLCLSPYTLHAQFPVATKVLAVESDSAPTSKAVGTVPRTATISDQCRSQLENTPSEKTSLGCYWLFLGLKNGQQADEYFGDLEVGSALALTYGEKNTTLYSELVSDNLWLSGGLGYVRIGLSTQVTAAQEIDDGGAGGESEAARVASADQLFQGGGNAMLHLTLPITVWINFLNDGSTNEAPVRRFDSSWFLASGVDVPALNAAIDSKTGSIRTGLQSYFTWRTFNANFKFFAQTSAAYVLGFNDEFYTNLIGTEIDRPEKGLVLVRGTFGVEIGNVASVGASVGRTSESSVRQPVRLTIQLLDRKNES